MIIYSYVCILFPGTIFSGTIIDDDGSADWFIVVIEVDELVVNDEMPSILSTSFSWIFSNFCIFSCGSNSDFWYSGAQNLSAGIFEDVINDNWRAEFLKKLYFYLTVVD